MATWVTLKSFFLCLLLFSGLLCYLAVVPAVVGPQGGLCNGQITPRGSYFFLGPWFCI